MTDEWRTTSVYEHGDTTIDVQQLNAITRANPILIHNIRDLLPSVSRSRRTGFSQRRLENASLEYPIVVTDQHEVLDGRHRVFKAMDAGRNHIKCRVATREQIAKCTLPSSEAST